MRFKHLTNVHSAWNTKWVQDDVNRSSVFHIWHVFDWEDLGDNTLVAVTSCQLVAHADLALLRNINADQLVYTWWQFVAGFAVARFA